MTTTTAEGRSKTTSKKGRMAKGTKPGLPSILIPDADKGETVYTTAYSDLILRMKCDIEVDEMDLSGEAHHQGSDGWSVLAMLEGDQRIFPTRKHEPPRPPLMDRQPLKPVTLKEHAARVIARAFRTAVERKQDLDDWLDMVRACGDMVKLEVWRAILDEGYTKSGMYLWKHDVLDIQDREISYEFLWTRRTYESMWAIRKDLVSEPDGLEEPS